MIKLIAMDMDGTLLSDDHISVSQNNRDALAEAHSKGIKLAIATGRTLSTTGNICDQIPEIDYIMFSNGAGVYDRLKDKIFYKNCMEWETASSFLPYLEKYSRFIELYVDGRAYAQNKDGEEFPYSIIPPVFIKELGKGITVVKDFTAELKGRDVEKVIFYTESEKDSDTALSYLTSIPDIFVSSSVKSSIEFTKAGADKGSAVSGICRYMGITEDEVMALGDAGNDIPMLRTAGYGIAMENADDITKSAARFITDRNTGDGVAKAIYKFALI